MTKANDGRRVMAGSLLAAGFAYMGLRAFRRTGESLEEKVVLITGGTRGLGLLLAHEFGRRGARVVICARDESELARAGIELRNAGVTVLTVPCDVADPEQVRLMTARATDHFGRVDVLVNNAGIIQVGPLEAMKVEDFRRAMDVIYWGSLYTTLEVLPQMRARGSGRIVNITSIGGKVAVPHLLPYDAAKFALVGFSEGLRAELRKDGISVTTIVPGLMRTGSPVNALFKGDHEKEFTWFSLASATPVTTMSARRAARRIVEASRRGEAQVTLSWQAKLLRLSHDLAPGVTSGLLGLVNRFLPTGSSPEERRGMHVSTALSPSPMTSMMNRAARRNNEFGGRGRPSAEHARKVGLNRGED
ncbi:MAG: SDR family NAD(P)-dependent oxidoreductase [Gemmatimonadota bacterium]